MGPQQQNPSEAVGKEARVRPGWGRDAGEARGERLRGFQRSGNLQIDDEQSRSGRSYLEE